MNANERKWEKKKEKQKSNWTAFRLKFPRSRPEYPFFFISVHSRSFPAAALRNSPL